MGYLVNETIPAHKEECMGLSEKKCIPCQIGTPPLKHAEILKYLTELSDDWFVEKNHLLKRTIEFQDFKEALDFVSRVGALAEEEGHHPEICFGWGFVTLHLQTLKIKGLSLSDFILAAKIDLL